MRPSGSLATLTALLVAVSSVVAPEHPRIQPTSIAAEPAGAVAGPGGDDPGKVDREVEKQVRGGATADFWVHFSAKADLSAASGIRTWKERGEYVVNQLRATATRSQQGVIGQLKTGNVRYRSFWAINAVLVRGGDARILDALKRRSEVGEIRAHQIYQLPKPAPGKLQGDAAVEWGIANINADDVWNAFGVRGEGVVVASIDSGVQFNHPALVRQYRGNHGDGTFDHNYNWFDPATVCGNGSEPCDNNRHGTHTMGTMVGDDGGANHIGVAPGAKWIAAKGCEASYCSQFALVASGEWMLAPTDVNGANPDPSRRPQVINNSWGGSSGNPWYRQIVQAWVAAGMFPAFANGNNGYGVCGTVGDPGSYPESFGVGAYDINDEIAPFSSLGPSPIDGSVKPDAAAPGVDVRSSVPGDAYASFSGTSMATPHLSGAVALMLSAAPALVGDVASTRAILDATARDTVDSAGCGGTLADNNTFGQGRIDVLAAVDAAPRGAVATLVGIVSDAAGGRPVAGAEVLVAGGIVPRRVRTGSDGTYQLTLSAGSYDVTVSAYGYHPVSAAITLAAGQTARRDFGLVAIARSVVRGKVSDGSGHGWPLYARINIAGYPGGPVFTDPVTGTYSIELVHETPYELTVTALVDGYGNTTRKLTLPADPVAQDFTLTAQGGCTAPGYTLRASGLFESFDSTQRPDGWEVVDNLGSGQVWTFEDVAGRGNRTGGHGGFAIVDSDAGGGRQDTELVTPAVDLTATDQPIIQFNQDVRGYTNEIFDVDLSTDGGATWSTVWHAAAQFGQGSLPGPRLQEIPIPGAAGKPAVKVRFHYYNANYAWWWQVDNVVVGQPACVPTPGGLVVGNATDGRTGLALNGAALAGPDASAAPATTAPTPADANLDDGFYAMFAPGAGTQTFTATKKLYGPTARSVDVVPDGVVRLDFPLRSGHLVAEPAVERTAAMGATADATLTVTNDGTADARIELSSRPGGVEIAAAGTRIAPRRTPADVTAGRMTSLGGATAPDTARAPSQAPWQDIADYPARVSDNAAAALDGKVYSAGGFSPDVGGLDGLYIYDPAANSWRHGRAMDEIREKPAAAFLGGKLYVVGGFDEFGVGRAAKRSMEIYDPANDSWKPGADLPFGSAGAGVAVLDGRMYVVGGCSGDSCTAQPNVSRYNPAAGAWESVSNYPEAVAWVSCAGDDARHKVYCAGGVNVHGKTSAYAYDPGRNEWTPIASLPIPLWGSAYAAANGQLAISGGITGNQVTNEGFVYDAFADAWDPLPPSNNATYRGAGACGLYRIGGIPAGSPTAASERLPEYGHCDSGDVSWLRLHTTTATVPAGQSVTVSMTLDATTVEQPGRYTAAIVIADDTPYSVSPVPVTLNVTPPPSWGKLTGTLTGLGRCDTGTTALRETTVDIDGVVKDFSLHADGTYQVWMDPTNGPVTVAVSAGGYARQVRGHVPIVAAGTTTENFALRLDQGCASVSPDRVDLAVEPDETATAEVVLNNAGAGSYGFTMAELPFVFDPVPGNAPNAIAASGWFGGASLPGGRQRYGHAQCDGDVGRFYVFGGIDAHRPSRDTAWRYNVATNTWTELAPVPEALESPTAVCEAGRIHLLGGSGTRAHYVYDTGANTWTAVAALPRPVRGAASAAWNGKIYLVGGDPDLNAGGTTGAVDVYDIATNTWTASEASMPVPAVAAGSVQAGQYLYVVGGWYDDSPATNVTATQRLDLATGRWTTGPAFHPGAADMALAATDTAIYTIGGDQPGGGFTDGSDTVFRLETRTWPSGAWAAHDKIPLRMSGNSAGFCTVGLLAGEIWSVGGVDQFRASDGRAYLHDIGAEQCATMRADVPWLSATTTTGTVPADGSLPLTVTVNATGLAPGQYGATLLIRTTDPGRPELRVPVRINVADAPPSQLLSLAGSGSVGGIEHADEDIIGINPHGKVTRFFDGSDVGLADLAIDAFARLADGSLVLSFDKPGVIPGIRGKVDDSDLVRFVPTSLGDHTAGGFQLWLDGSDVGLTTDGENIDAVEVLEDGRVLLSTAGVVTVRGVNGGDDSDLIIFTPTSLGTETAGTFRMYFDGSDVGLNTADEDIDAVAIRADGVIGLSTIGEVAVPGLAASDDDVIGFTATRLGSDTRGSFSPEPLFDGAAFGLDASDVTAFDFG